MNAKQKISIGTAVREIVVLPNDANHYGTIFGGTLLSLMDGAAFIAAKKYAQNDVVTVSVDNVVFKSPIKVGQIAKISAYVSNVGSTSVEICVNVTSDGKDVIENAYFKFVNINSDGKPIPILSPEFCTKEEKARYEKRLREKERITQCITSVQRP